jgi:hypothetical protein
MGPGSRADDRLDALRARQLSNEFEAAAARRDRRAMATVDARFQAFVSQELAEARRDLARAPRGHQAFEERGAVNRLESLQRQLVRLAGRVDRQSVNQKRELYAQARTLAQRALGETGRRRG